MDDENATDFSGAEEYVVHRNSGDAGVGEMVDGESEAADAIAANFPDESVHLQAAECIRGVAMRMARQAQRESGAQFVIRLDRR